MSNPNSNPKDKIVHLKCKKSGCGSMTAKVALEQPNGTRMYVCTKCNTPQTINLGGHFPF